MKQSAYSRLIAVAALATVATLAASCSTANPPGTVTSTGSATQSGASQTSPASLGTAPSISNYVNYAVANNKGLLAAQRRWEASQSKTAQVSAWPEPKVSFSRENGSGLTADTYGISQELPFFGKSTLAGNSASAMAESERFKYETQRAKLVRDVTTAYADYYYLGRQVKVTIETLQLMNGLEGSMRAKYATGTEPQAPLLQIQIEIARMENDLRTLNDNRSAFSARLAALVNTPTQPLLPWPETIETPPATANEQQLRAAIAKQNPELKIMDALIKAEDSNLTLAKAGWLPDLEARFERKNETMDTGQILPQDTSTFMIALSLPLWVTKKNAAIAESISNKEGAIAEREQLASNLESDLATAIAARRDADRRITLYRDNLVPKARQAWDVTRKEYETGKGTFADLVASQRTLLELTLGLEKALVDCVNSQAAIEMLFGGNEPADNKTK